MSNDEIGSYNDSHRALLQAFFAKPSLSFQDAIPILAAIFTAQSTDLLSLDTLPSDYTLGDREVLNGDIVEADFTNYIAVINSNISSLDYEIRSTLPQSTDEVSENANANGGTSRSSQRVWALVNTTSDAMTQLATNHTPEEIAFVKRLLDAIFETYNTRQHEVMAITSLQALKLNRPSARAANDGIPDGENGVTAVGSAGLTKSEAERTLAALVAEGWLQTSAAEYYSLSPRALMELRDWLRETYNDDEDAEQDADEERENMQRIKSCHACREIVTVGQRCADYDCKARLHNRCVGQMFRAQQGAKTCPLCKREWTGEDHVGEKAARDGRRRTNGAAGRNSIANGAGHTRRTTQTVVSDDSDE